MANSFEYADWICMEGLRTLKNKSAVSPFFNTDYNKEYSRAFPVGETVRIPLPQRFIIRDGIRRSPQPIRRRHTDVTMQQPFGIDFDYDTVERALKMGRDRDHIRDQYIKPAMEQIALEIDQRCARWAYQNTNNIVGVLGTNPTAMSTYTAAERRLFEHSCPDGENRGLIMSPGMNTSFVDNTTTVYNPASDISKQWRTGRVGFPIAGFDPYRSNCLYSHTAGTWAGTVEVTNAVATGVSSMTITCTNGDTFMVGDAFNIAGVYDVNPGTRRTTGTLKQFRVTVAMTGTGTDTLYFFPQIEGPGSQYQNVDSLPTAGADLTLFPGTSSPNGKSGIQGLALHRDAFALVGLEMENPKNAEMAGQARDPESGIPIAIVKDWNNEYRRFETRIDTAIGFGNLYSDECAVRVLSAT